MRMYDIILKKREGGELSPGELEFFIQGYTSGAIPDYQAAALLMAVYFRGLSGIETAELTRCMAQSGRILDLSSVEGVKVDKHSTGGVGDKTTLIAAPVAAACGVKVPKLSGRGLGHTGGTIDKLESIPGFTTSLPLGRFIEIVNETGVCIASAAEDIAPADKKLYALRDVIAAVDSPGLIASSIMSKKLACGADAIVFDVKVGSGAFMQDTPSAMRLAQSMVDIGRAWGKPASAVLTDMDVPLGRQIGNALEVSEALSALKNESSAPSDLRRVSLELAAEMIYLAGGGTLAECRIKAENALDGGWAYDRFCRMTAAQGGDLKAFEKKYKNGARHIREITADRGGYIALTDTRKIGTASVQLGAGRNVKDGAVDYYAGITLLAKTGDKIAAGDIIALLHASEPDCLDDAEATFVSALKIDDNPPAAHNVILGRVGGRL